MLVDINGKPLLWHILDRLSNYNVIIATTHGDTQITDFCMGNKIHYFRGDEQDILCRIYGAAKAFGLDTIVRVWGDCPLPSPVIIGEAIKSFEKENPQYLYTDKYPKGQNVAVMPFGFLETWNTNLINPEHRHWFHRWCISKPWAVCKESPMDFSHINLCIDTQEDLDRIREIMSC
jgi:spore coat polysaccharide biosynthesis protein SpsF